MTTFDIYSSLTLRLNKSATNKYDNFWISVVEETWHKAQLDWVRRQIRGKNQTQEGDEETEDRIDDLQILLKAKSVTHTANKLYNEFTLPVDYLYHKRVTPFIEKEECKSKSIKSSLEEESNVDILIQDKIPSFKFEETFHTMMGNNCKVFHNQDFKIKDINIIYYRLPKTYKFSQLESEAETIEFKEDICHLILDECVKINASDIESINQKQLAQERNEYNN